MTIAPKTSVSDRPHRIVLQNPVSAPDGEGGFIEAWTDLSPAAVQSKIAPATAADLERVTAGTIISQASHIVTFPFHPGVTTQTRILYNGRRFNVSGVADPEERHVETIALCVEVVL